MFLHTNSWRRSLHQPLLRQSSTFICLIRFDATSLIMRVSPPAKSMGAIIMSMLPKSCPRRFKASAKVA